MVAAGTQSSSHFFPDRFLTCKHVKELAKLGYQLAMVTEQFRPDSTNSRGRRFSLAGCFSNSSAARLAGSIGAKPMFMQY